MTLSAYCKAFCNTIREGLFNMSSNSQTNRLKSLMVAVLALCVALSMAACTGGKSKSSSSSSGSSSSSSSSSRLSDEEKVEFGKNLMTEGTPEHDWYENTYKKEHGIK